MSGATQPSAATAGPDPRRVQTAADLVRELDLLRRRAASGTRQARISLEDLARRTGIPRSTVHSYISGARLPPPDSLDELVIALDADSAEQREWAEALFRVSADAPAPPPARRPDVPRQLPAAPRILVGRESELQRLDALLPAAAALPDALVIGIAGTGGIGKTALALTWAHRVSARFPDGQLWVDLRGYGPGHALTPADALERLLRGVGVVTSELPVDSESRAAMFRSAVAGRRLLVVLDNARDSAQILELLPGSAGCLTLVTSRTVLRSLVALDAAETVSVGRLSTETALDLLGSGARDTGAATTALRRRIAELCAGLPLALRIVRARLQQAGEAEIARFADELGGDGEARLAALHLTDAGTEVSVRGALRWSYDALPADAAELFALLPFCYQSTFPLRVAAAAHGVDEATARRELDVLVGASLLDTAGPDRFRVHDLVLAFADECRRHDLAEDVVDAARLRMAAFLVAFTHAQIDRLDPGLPLRTAIPAHLADHRHLEVTAEDHVDADTMAAAILDLVAHEQAPAAWGLCERAARALGPRADLLPLEPAVRVALASAQQADDGVAVVTVARHLGIMAARRGELDLADRDFSTAIDWARRHGLANLEAVDTGNRAIVWMMRGDTAAARALMARQVPLLRATGEHAWNVLLSLVEIDLDRDDVEAAYEWNEQARAEAGAAQFTGVDRLDLALSSARVDGRRGRFDDAYARLTELEKLAREEDRRDYLAQVHLLRAELGRDTGDLERAAANALRASTGAREIGERRLQVDALVVYGEVVRRQGRALDAVAILEETVAQAEEIGLQHATARSQADLAAALRDAGDRERAREVAGRARQIAQACGLVGVLRRVDEVLADLQTDG